SLYDLDKALGIFDELEEDPGFGGVLSKTIKNKIIYDKASIVKNQTDGDEKALDYLNSLEDSTISNEIFASWIEKEIHLLTPPLIEEEPEEDIDESEDNNEGEQVIEDESETGDKISIGKYEFYIEEVIIVFLVLLVLIFIITRIIKRRRRRRSSI